MFDFNVVSARRRKYKQFEQQIWEAIYWRLNKNKIGLVGEEKLEY